MMDKKTFIRCMTALINIEEKENKFTNFLQRFDNGSDIAWVGLYHDERELLIDLIVKALNPPEDEEYGTIIEKYLYDLETQETYSLDDIYNMIIAKHSEDELRSLEEEFEEDANEDDDECVEYPDLGETEDDWVPDYVPKSGNKTYLYEINPNKISITQRDVLWANGKIVVLSPQSEVASMENCYPTYQAAYKAANKEIREREEFERREKELERESEWNPYEDDGR